MSKMQSTQHFQYAGRDLEAMSFAVKYHQWILEIFRPYLGQRVVEVGAGTGSFSEMLSGCDFQSLSVVEPSAMFAQLLETCSVFADKVEIATYQSTFGEVATRIKESQNPDSIIYVNVLEHIEDDERELAAIHATLSDNGRLFVFVPALKWLYGSFDAEIGHFRRYQKAELQRKCENAGFKLLLCRYFDFAGVVPWWLNYRLLKSRNMSGAAVKAYDQFVVPLTKLSESLITPPFGKNLILVAEKR